MWSTGSRCTVFSSCRMQAQQLQLAGSRAQAQLWRMALVALQHVESSWTRDQTHVPCTGRQILIHCTNREVLGPYLLLVLNVSSLFHCHSYSKTSEYVTCFASNLKPFFNIHSSYSTFFFFPQDFVVSRTKNSINLAQVKGFLRVIYVISQK